MEITPTQLSRLKKIELDMLKEFVAACDKLGLKYYLTEGTLLGAVRHKGFIPWDDDIDVAMPRKDYEIFMKEGQALLSEHLFLQNIDTDKEYNLNFAKIRNSETTFVEIACKNLKFNHGAYIDVFPLDYFPEKEKERKVFYRKNFIYRLRLCAGLFLPRNKKIKFKLANLVLKMIFPSEKKVARKRELMFKAVPKSTQIANFCGAWDKREIVPEEWYGEGCELQFEGLTLNVPVEYDKWLTKVYGDYMQLPPIEERKGHHFAEIIDLEKSYREYEK